MVGFPNQPMGFSTIKTIVLGCEMGGYHHLRKHPYVLGSKQMVIPYCWVYKPLRTWDYWVDEFIPYCMDILGV